MGKRGAYFFVIDAFIASIIIIIGLAVIFGRHSDRPATAQTFYSAEDFLSTIESTEVRNIDNEQIRLWMTNKIIDDPKRHVIEQIVIFKLTNNISNMTFLTSVAANSTPSNINLQVALNGTDTGYYMIYLRNNTPKEASNVMLTGKRIVLLRKSQTELYSPIIVEAQTWQ